MSKDLNPARIMQIGMGFWASKTLLSAVELGLFTALGEGPLTGPQIRERLGLHPRPLYDFLDALLALGMLERDGDGPPARYRNSAETARFLDKRSPAYIGGLLEMASARLFRHWSHLTTALQTGLPQSEAKDGAAGFFEAVYSDERRLEQFIAGMQGGQFGNFQALLENVEDSPRAVPEPSCGNRCWFPARSSKRSEVEGRVHRGVPFRLGRAASARAAAIFSATLSEACVKD